MPKVLIDGELYISAKKVLANRMQIAKGILESFWGTCSDEKAEEFIKRGDITVSVNDWGEGIPLSEVLDNIAKIA